MEQSSWETNRERFKKLSAFYADLMFVTVYNYSSLIPVLRHMNELRTLVLSEPTLLYDTKPTKELNSMSLSSLFRLYLVL
jgi:hypothetical protein